MLGPRAAETARPLQHVKVARGRSRYAQDQTPAVRLVIHSPLDHFLVSAGCSRETCGRDQHTSVRDSALQNFKAGVLSDTCAYSTLSQTTVEAPLKLRYSGVRRYRLRDFRELPPCVFSVYGYLREKRILIG